MSNDSHKSLQTATKQLVEHLRRTNQLGTLPQLVKSSLEQTSDQLPENTALVKSAYKLTGSELSELKSSLTSMLSHSVTIKNVVDKDVIAGLYIRIGDRIIDQTLGNIIDSLGEDLLQ